MPPPPSQKRCCRGCRGRCRARRRCGVDRRRGSGRLQLRPPSLRLPLPQTRPSGSSPPWSSYSARSPASGLAQSPQAWWNSMFNGFPQMIFITDGPGVAPAHAGRPPLLPPSAIWMSNFRPSLFSTETIFRRKIVRPKYCSAQTCLIGKKIC